MISIASRQTQFWTRARGIFGPRPELIAMHVHLLRHFRDFNAARSLLASASNQTATNFALWLETLRLP